MKFVTMQTPAGPRAAIVRRGDHGEEAVDLSAVDPQLPSDLKQLLEGGDALLARAAQAALAAKTGVPLDQAKLRRPILEPQKILCIGLNYADHAAETGAKVGEEPVVFNKLPTTLRDPGDPIELPPESTQVDYEAELVVVIGKTARRVSRTQAWHHIAGYCCGNDVSARDWQKDKPGKQWLLGKSFDSFGPVGPWLVTADDVVEPHELAIECRLNGQVMQSSSTRQIIFPVDYLVSYLSHVATLLPGDLIFTGTPPGVGMARTPPVYLKPGDVVEVAVENLGTLSNPVKAI
jgi:2-keto-4-pentenoate hydratase/2-oxohepta-3-ene-1,7-dioic acid hydratase in catechol pathway